MTDAEYEAAVKDFAVKLQALRDESLAALRAHTEAVMTENRDMTKGVIAEVRKMYGMTAEQMAPMPTGATAQATPAPAPG